MAGLYIHIPFCKQACYYCDFHFSTNRELSTQLCEALATELYLQRDYLQGESLTSIYLGGGTPSLLSGKELDIIFNSIIAYYTLEPNLEITVEANPDDLTPEKLSEFRQTGINRLSVGIQSFDPSVLKFLNRAHDAQAALDCVPLARDAGFNNISIDLIYSIPGQDNDAWGKNLEQAIHLSPDHISSYSLSIEEKTTFGRWQQAGKLKAMDEETAAQQFELLMDELQGAGFEQYEISNFSKPGFNSRHNSSYWAEKKYLGIGPSAHSYNRSTRQFNIRNNHLYLKSIAEQRVPFELEVLTQANKINEFIFTTLRTSRGCDLMKVKRDYGYDIPAISSAYLTNLVQHQLAFLDNHVLKLSRSGKLLADKIAADLFAEENQ